MKNELVSIIIPTYNRRDYLQIAIDSVLGQTYSNYELIIIDDGSTDNTKKIIQEKYGNRVIYVWQENQGESIARNTGISIARGNYIAFLDSDDYWDPRKLEFQVNCLHGKNMDSIAGVFSAVWLVGESGSKIEEKPKGTIRSRRDLKFENFLLKPVIIGTLSNILLRTECLREIGGFDPTIQYGEDKDLLLRLRSKWDFYYIDTPLVYLRRHRSNQSKVISEQAIQKVFSDRIKVISKNADSNNKSRKQVVDRVINHILISAASWCFYYGRWEDGIQYLIQVKDGGRNVIYKTLPPKIAHIASLKFFQQENRSAEKIEKFIYDSFIDKIIENWDKLLGDIPIDEIKGHFFQEVMLQTKKIRYRSFQYLFVLFLKYKPQLINQNLFLTLLNLD